MLNRLSIREIILVALLLILALVQVLALGSVPAQAQDTPPAFSTNTPEGLELEATLAADVDTPIDGTPAGDDAPIDGPEVFDIEPGVMVPADTVNLVNQAYASALEKITRLIESIVGTVGGTTLAGLALWKITPILLTAAQALATWTSRKDDDTFVQRIVTAFEKIGIRPILPVGYTPSGSPLYPPEQDPYQRGPDGGIG